MRLTRHITGSEDPRIARSPVPVYDDPGGTTQSRPARQGDLLDVAVTDKRLDLDAEMHLDTVAAMQVQQPRGQLWSQSRRQWSRQLFDDRYADSGASSG